MTEPGEQPVVVVTGGTAGIGRAVVREFAARGYDVAVLARGTDGLDAAVADVEQAGRRALAVPTDVADAEAVDAAARTVETELGPISVWVNKIYLRSLVGVPDGPTALALRWAPVLLVVPALWVVRAHLHGVLMAAGATAVFVRAGAVHAVVLAGTVAVLGATALPGVGAACFASSPGCSPTSASPRSVPGLDPGRRGTTRVPERAGRSPSWPSPPPPTSSTS